MAFGGATRGHSGFGSSSVNPFETPRPQWTGLFGGTNTIKYDYPVPIELNPGDFVIYHTMIGGVKIKEPARIGGLIGGADQAANSTGVYWLAPVGKDLDLKNATIYAVKANLVKPKHAIGDDIQIKIGKSQVSHAGKIVDVCLENGKIRYRISFKDASFSMSEEELE